MANEGGRESLAGSMLPPFESSMLADWCCKQSAEEADFGRRLGRAAIGDMCVYSTPNRPKKDQRQPIMTWPKRHFLLLDDNVVLWPSQSHSRRVCADFDRWRGTSAGAVHLHIALVLVPYGHQIALPINAARLCSSTWSPGTYNAMRLPKGRPS